MRAKNRRIERGAIQLGLNSQWHSPMKSLATTFLLALTLFPCPAADWFVATNGSPEALGTQNAPWDLQTALDGPAAVKPGDTIWLLPGTYRHPDRTHIGKGFLIKLSGAPGAPVTIRNHNGQRATIDGGLQTDPTAIPKHLRVWGLEVVVSENFGSNRKTDRPGSHPDRGRPNGGIRITAGYDLKFINNIVHSNSQAFGFWKTVGGDSELYGNIAYDNGWLGPDRHHGHGLYTQNGSGDYKFVRDNLFLENWGNCLQAYGSSKATIEKYRIEGNTFWGLNAKDNHNVSFGGSPASKNREAQFANNLHYRASLILGFGNPAHDVTVTDSTFIRCASATYPGSTRIEIAESVRIWRREHPNHPAPDDIVHLRPNRYEPDRAYLSVIQPAREADKIKADLSGFLRPGDAFRLLHARDFFGKPALTGEFDGSLVEIPMERDECRVYVVLRSPK